MIGDPLFFKVHDNPIHIHEREKVDSAAE